jgi:hypothetical protein
MGMLIIVDVQRDLLRKHADFVRKVWDLAKGYSKVVQIWDSNFSGPDFTFPNQVKLIEKQYGFDAYDNNLELYLSPEDAKSLLSGERESYMTKDGRMLVSGNQHPWFLADTDLVEFCQGLNGASVDVAGGAEEECLDDVLSVLRECGVKYNVVMKYNAHDQSYELEDEYDPAMAESHRIIRKILS